MSNFAEKKSQVAADTSRSPTGEDEAVSFFLDRGEIAIAPLPPSVPPRRGGLIRIPTSSDVLCGRGGHINNHEGNVRFRDLVSKFKHLYLAKTSKKLAKANIAATVVQIIRDLDPPGKFLEMDKETKKWVEVGDVRARKKAGQALREDAPEIRIEIEKKEEKKNAETESRNAPQSPPPGHPHSPNNCDHGAMFTTSPTRSVGSDKYPTKSITSLNGSISTVGTQTYKDLLSVSGSNITDSKTSTKSVKFAVVDSNNGFKSGDSGSFGQRDQGSLLEILKGLSDKDLQSAPMNTNNSTSATSRSRIGRIIEDSSRSLISALSTPGSTQRSALQILRDTLSQSVESSNMLKSDTKSAFTSKDREMLLELLKEASNNDVDTKRTVSENRPGNANNFARKNLIDPRIGKLIKKSSMSLISALTTSARSMDKDALQMLIQGALDNSSVKSFDRHGSEGMPTFDREEKEILLDLADVLGQTDKDDAKMGCDNVTIPSLPMSLSAIRESTAASTSSLLGNQKYATPTSVSLSRYGNTNNIYDEEDDDTMGDTDDSSTTDDDSDEEEATSRMPMLEKKTSNSSLSRSSSRVLNRVMCFRDPYKFKSREQKRNELFSQRKNSRGRRGGNVQNASSVSDVKFNYYGRGSNLHNNVSAEKVLSGVWANNEGAPNGTEGDDGQNDNTETTSVKSIETVTTGEMNDAMSLTNHSVTNLLRAQQKSREQKRKELFSQRENSRGRRGGNVQNASSVSDVKFNYDGRGSNLHNNVSAEKVLSGVWANIEGAPDNTETTSVKPTETVTTGEMNDAMSLTSHSVTNLLRAQQTNGSCSTGPRLSFSGVRSLSSMSCSEQGTGRANRNHKGYYDSSVVSDDVGQSTGDTDDDRSNMDLESTKSSETWLKSYDGTQEIGIGIDPSYNDSTLSNVFSDDSINLC